MNYLFEFPKVVQIRNKLFQKKLINNTAMFLQNWYVLSLSFLMVCLIYLSYY